MIKIKIGQKIKMVGLPKSVKNRLQSELTLSNPKYYKILNSNSIPKRAIYGMEKEFKYYKKMNNRNDGLVVPRGLRGRLFEYFETIGADYKVISDDFVEKSCDSLESNVTLRGYQKPIVEKIVNNRDGVVVMSTGSGKTICMWEAICRLGLTATVLVPNKTLQDNWAKECKEHWGHEPNLINGSNKEVGDINVSTFGSLYNNKNLRRKLSKNTSILVVDECHGGVTDNRIQVLRTFTPKHLYGLTATKMREDGKEDAINFIFGKDIAKFHKNQLSPTIEVEMSNEKIPIDDYHVMIEDMIHNESRNTMIAGIATGEGLCEGNKVLVLVKRKKHGELIMDMLPNSNMVLKIDGDVENRNEIIQQLKTGKRDFRIIVGTTALLSTGTDIPALDKLILACDMKAEALTIQSAGRILRVFEGKEDPRIIDIYDHKNGILDRQFKQRLKTYRKQNWDVEGLPHWLQK